jgi:hypothetical protein
MANLSSNGTNLELGEHPEFERVWRGVQTVVFGFLVVLVSAALVGVLGSGPAAFGRSDAGNFKLEFQRFASARSQSRMKVEVQNAAPRQLQVWIDGKLARAMGIDSIKPAPVVSALEAGGTRYVFAAGRGGGTVEFGGKPMEPGLARGTVQIDGRNYSVQQLVWP